MYMIVFFYIHRVLPGHCIAKSALYNFLTETIRKFFAFFAFRREHEKIFCLSDHRIDRGRDKVLGPK
jgi:hypothetical protein